jgi:hypothetical protein
MEDMMAEQPRGGLSASPVERYQHMTVSKAIAYLQVLEDQHKGDEPVFILRGQDRLAVPVIFYWAQLAEKHGVKVSKYAGAWHCAEQMASWPNRKTPD